MIGMSLPTSEYTNSIIDAHVLLQVRMIIISIHQKIFLQF
jgi:hypothetical protein